MLNRFIIYIVIIESISYELYLFDLYRFQFIV